MPSRKDAIRIWLAIVDFVGIIGDYELAAVNHVFGWHTISYFASLYPILGWGIFVAGIGVLVFWWHHFHSKIYW